VVCFFAYFFILREKAHFVIDVKGENDDKNMILFTVVII